MNYIRVYGLSGLLGFEHRRNACPWPSGMLIVEGALADFDRTELVQNDQPCNCQHADHCYGSRIPPGIICRNLEPEHTDYNTDPLETA